MKSASPCVRAVTAALLLLACSASREPGVNKKSATAAASAAGPHATVQNTIQNATNAGAPPEGVPDESPKVTRLAEPTGAQKTGPAVHPQQNAEPTPEPTVDTGTQSTVQNDDDDEAVPGWPARRPESDCPKFGRGRVRFRFQDGRLPETSGIALGHHQADWVYAHNDSGDSPRIFALDWGGVRAELEFAGQQVYDAEDMAVALDNDGKAWLYLADTGDNLERRYTGVFLLRAPEPQVAPSQARVALRPVEQVHVRFPTGALDVEAMLVDPLTSDVVLISKGRDGHNHVFRVPSKSFVDGSALAEAAADLHLGLVTAADITADGRLIIVRTYTDAWLWLREPTKSVADALREPACKLPLAIERQGESIAWARDGSGYYTISEGTGQALYYYPRLKP